MCAGKEEAGIKENCIIGTEGLQGHNSRAAMQAVPSAGSVDEPEAKAQRLGASGINQPASRATSRMVTLEETLLLRLDGGDP